MTDLQEKLACLDSALTGVTDWQFLSLTARNNDASQQSLCERKLYYLSDGGYSRLLCVVDDDDNPHLRLVDPQKRVADNWGNCVELRADVEAILAAWLHS